MVIASAKTPHYVLRHGASPLCLQHSQMSPAIATTVIYGFCDKPDYDIFIASSKLPLTPFPLVKGYLERAIGADLLHLIVLDAVSAEQEILSAASFEAVLASLNQNEDVVLISHRLVKDDASSSYRVESVTHFDEVTTASRQE